MAARAAASDAAICSVAAQLPSGSVGRAPYVVGDGTPDAALLARDEGATPAGLKHAILHLLAANPGPLGSGSLMEQLQAIGYAGSEPTVGRFLRLLDRSGFTVRVSNKGRELTAAGRAELQRLCEAESQRHYERELIQTIRSTTIDDILDVLVARRAMERETARLAAEHATPEEIGQLETTIQEQRQELATRGIAADADVKFHVLLAEAGHNRVLGAAVELIRRDKRLAVLLEVILKQASHKWVVGHERILAAVKRRAPDAAERAMVEHINTVIADISRYRDHLELVVGQEAAQMPDAGASPSPPGGG